MVQGPMSEDPQFETVWAPDAYPYTTTSAVRYVPVTLQGDLIGYLWAAVTDDALDFIPRASAADRANNAAVKWVHRLRWAKANGVTPLQALRHWAGQQEDPLTGYVPEDAEQEAPSLGALEALAAAG